MNAKLQKWGNSLGLRIPKHIAAQANLSEGSSLVLAVEGQKIVVSPRHDSPTLASLVDTITAENRHIETDFGPAQGKEIW